MKYTRWFLRGRRIWGPALALVCACLFLSSCMERSDGDDDLEEAPINVRAEKPLIMDMEEVIEVHGNLDPKKQAEVVAEVSGPVVELYVDESDRVSDGQVLAKIDDEEYRLSYQQSKSAYQVARSDYYSSKDLYKQGMKSKSEYEKIRRSYLDAKTNLEMSRIRLDNTEVKSPIDGVVIKRNIEKYQQVGTMESLFRVADLSGYVLKITVTEAEVAKLRTGQDVRIRIDAVTPEPDAFPFSGKVSKIQPMVDPQTGTVEVEVSLDDPGMGVRPGMFARLKIVTAVHENAMVIPRRALTAEDDRHVWVIGEGGARFVEIKTGLASEKNIEIVSGLSPDDLVITEGQGAITPKSKINIVNREETASEEPPQEPAEK